MKKVWKWAGWQGRQYCFCGEIQASDSNWCIMEGCPVKHDEVKSSESCPVDHESRSGLLSWFDKQKLPHASQKSVQGVKAGKSNGLVQRAGPSLGENRKSSGETVVTGYNAPANDMAFSDEPYKGQQMILSTTRTLSGIPKGGFSPSHQPKQSIGKWVYPSEQQYYNAMKRKGYNPSEADVSSILAVHNVVNERSWREILKWESFRGCEDPKLLRFVGRPKDLSPKAQLLTFLGSPAPFDRHDWFVDRDGQQVRYIIDFYEVSKSNAKVPIHLDVRPALDSFGSLVHRVQMMMNSFSVFKPSTGRR